MQIMSQFNQYKEPIVIKNLRKIIFNNLQITKIKIIFINKFKKFFMAYLTGQLAIFAVLVLLAASQAARTVPSPDPSWDDYKVKACCPQGFIEVSNYCVQCNAPNVFDAIDQRCRPCPFDHTYNNQTKSCDCKVPCALPRQLNANNICECPADQKGNRRVFNQGSNTCACPPELPLWNGKYCVVCPAGTQFDQKEKQCYHCPDGFIRDRSSHACVPGL